MITLAESDCTNITKADTLRFWVYTQGADKAEWSESSHQEAVDAVATGAIVHRA